MKRKLNVEKFTTQSVKHFTVRDRRMSVSMDNVHMFRINPKTPRRHASSCNDVTGESDSDCDDFIDIEGDGSIIQ